MQRDQAYPNTAAYLTRAFPADRIDERVGYKRCSQPGREVLPTPSRNRLVDDSDTRVVPSKLVGLWRWRRRFSEALRSFPRGFRVLLTRFLGNHFERPRQHRGGRIQAAWQVETQGSRSSHSLSDEDDKQHPSRAS